MKRFITFSLLLSTAAITFAQNVDKSITLDEVTVRASKVVNKPDGMVIYPTDSQRQASTNGYSFLENSPCLISALTISTTPYPP